MDRTMSALETRLKTKQEQSEAINDDIAEFLASGKKIRKIKRGLSGERVMGFNNQNLRKKGKLD